MTDMQTIGISLGGSILSTEKGFNTEFASKFAKLLESRKNIRFLVTTGGGYVARSHIASVRDTIKSVFVLDEIGTAFTRTNALMLKSMFSEESGVYPTVPLQLDELKRSFRSNRIVVFGGLMEGITTDTDAVFACEAAECHKLLNVSKSTAYVYDKDPKEKGAKKLEHMTHDEMIDLAHRSDMRHPGTNFVFDVVAAKLSKRSNIDVYFSDENLDNIRDLIDGKRGYGTVVTSK